MLRYMLPCIAALVLITPTPGVQDEAPAIGKTTLRSLERLAVKLAKAGCESETDEALAVLRDLGRAGDAQGKLAERCRSALDRVKRRKPSRSLARDAQRAAARLAAGIDAGRGSARRRAVASAVLRIDDSVEAARLALEHVKTDGVWRSPEEVTWHRRRRLINEALRDVRSLEIPLQVGESRDDVLVSATGEPGTLVRYQGLEIHSTLAPARAERMVRQALRAVALSELLIEGKLEVPAVGRQRWVFISSRPQYRKVAKACIAAGGMDEDYAKIALDISGYFERTGRGVFHVTGEVGGQAIIVRYLRLDALRDYQANLRAGHLQWLARTFLGVPMPGLAWLETTETAGGGGPKGYDRAVSEEEKKKRETLLRLADAGIAGSRAWMAYLAERGEDPPFYETIVDEPGKLSGVHLLKALHVVEHLQECAPLGEILRDTAPARHPDQADAFKSALGPWPRFEERWRRWLLPRRGGIVQRLGTGTRGTAEALTPSQKSALDYLQAVRGRAFESLTAFAPHDVVIEPSLSRGCELHAAYLQKNREQLAAWPDAHEEYADKEGFTAKGCWAGLNGVIAPGVGNAREAIDGWMGTFYHRTPLIDPGLVGIGWGLQAGVAVLDCQSLLIAPGGPWAVSWPAPGARGVPTRFNPELPNPVPGADQSRWGYPVTLQICGEENHRPGSGSMTLHRGDEKGAVVPCHLSTPAAPTNPELAPAGTFCLIPRERLAPSTRYTVVAEIEGADRVVWSFDTGR